MQCVRLERMECKWASDFLQAWSQGGYSDDLIVAAKCSEGKLPIICPSFTVFPQWSATWSSISTPALARLGSPGSWFVPLRYQWWCHCRLDGEYDAARYWNYLRRQVYVMDTYASPLNRQINHAFMVIHSYLSLAFVLPLTTGTKSPIFHICISLSTTDNSSLAAFSRSPDSVPEHAFARERNVADRVSNLQQVCGCCIWGCKSCCCPLARFTSGLARPCIGWAT